MSNKYSISQIIDSFGVSKFTISLWLMVGITLCFDGFDYMIVPYTMPLMSKEWALSAVQTGSLFSWSLIGLVIGGVIAGSISDRFGRKKTLVFFCAAYSLLTLPIYWVTSFEAFALFRVLSGIGLGACLPVGVTMMSETVPTKNRGFFSASMMAFYISGWVAAGIVAVFVIPAYGWRPCFLVGAMPILYAAFLMAKLVESPHWLLSKGREAEAINVIKEMEIAARGIVSKRAPGSLVTPPPVKKVGVMAMFSPEYRKATAAVWLLWFFGTMVVTGIIAWLPTLLIGKGFGLIKGYSFSILQNVVGLVGALSTGYAADIIGRKKNVTLAYVFTVISIFMLAYTSNEWILVGVVSVGLFMNWGLSGVYPLCAEAYRTEFRTTGVAWAAACGRVGGVCGPIIAGFAQQMGADFSTTFAIFSLPAAIAALTGAFVVTETKGKSFESLCRF